MKLVPRLTLLATGVSAGPRLFTAQAWGAIRAFVITGAVVSGAGGATST